MRPIADRNARLCLVYHVALHAPLYWPYMYFYVTTVHGLSGADFGALKSIYYFSVLLLELPLGVVADRLGRRGALALGAACCAASCVVYAQSTTFVGFAIAEVAIAFSSALESGALSAMLYDSFATEGRESDYPRMESLRLAVGLAAGTVALLLADALLASTGDARLAYVATSGLGVIGVAAALAMKEPPRERSDSARQIAGEAVRDLLRTPTLLALVVYSGAAFVGIRAANALVFNPVMHAAGLPETTYGTVSAGTTVIAAVFAMRASGWVDRLGLPATSRPSRSSPPFSSSPPPAGQARSPRSV